MKLYTYDPAPNPRRLALFMAYKGIEIETHQVDMMSGEQLGEEYRAINPLCTVPALVLDDGTVLTEVIGQCVYLEGMFPDKPLLGTSPLERAQVISADHLLFATAFMPIADMLRNSKPAFTNRALPGPLNVPQLEVLVERGKMRLDYAWQSLDATLGQQQWIAGHGPSFADIDLLVLTEFAGWVKESVPQDCANLQRWLQQARAEFMPG